MGALGLIDAPFAGRYWPSVGAELDALEAMEVSVAFVAVVARLAQRLQWSRQERPPIAAMWRDMVSNGCWDGQSTFGAHGADWFDHQLISTTSTPTLELVPGAWVILPWHEATWHRLGALFVARGYWT
jgi:hypothetical protein